MMDPVSSHTVPSRKVTNEPHPLLDFPALYFVLQHFPATLEPMRSVYSIRWRLSYRLQRQVHCKFLYNLGIHPTWSDIFLWVPFLAVSVWALIHTLLSPSVIATGKMSRWAIITCFVLAQHNSLMTLLFGLPFDRGLLYHKLAGCLAVFTGMLHTIVFVYKDSSVQKLGLHAAVHGQTNLSGTILLGILLVMGLSSMPWIRRTIFEAFYFLHVFGAMGVTVCAFFHSGILVPTLVLLTWGFDAIVRYIVMARVKYPRIAKIRIVSDTVCELSFRKTTDFCYSPGQFVWLCVPDLSCTEWHPLSITSAPCQEYVKLNVKALGNWTSQLYKLAQNQREVNIMIEGPYGSVSVDIMSDRKYKNLLLLSGGIGVTPMQSICDQLLYEQQAGIREINKLRFVWVERDPVMMQQVDVVKKTASLRTLGTQDSSVSSRSLDEASSNALPVSLTAQILSLPMSTFNENDDDYSVVSKSADYQLGSESLSLEEDEENGFPSQDVLDLQVYLSSSTSPQNTVPFAKAGRPDVKDIFKSMRRDAIQSGDNRVAVCISAPKKLTDLCRRACVAFSDKKVRFDCHTESMKM